MHLVDTYMVFKTQFTNNKRIQPSFKRNKNLRFKIINKTIVHAMLL